jgi:hypothetical protein
MNYTAFISSEKTDQSHLLTLTNGSYAAVEMRA